MRYMAWHVDTAAVCMVPTVLSVLSSKAQRETSWRVQKLCTAVLDMLKGDSNLIPD